MAEWSIAAVLKTVELRGSGGSNPSLSATQNEERVQQGSFFVYRHMDINLLNGNVLRYKKESCSATSSFWVAQDARGRVWAFEVGERSEVGALESLSLRNTKKGELYTS